jgi:hypothetical protein
MYAQINMYIMLIFKVNDDQNLTKLMYLEVHAEIKLVQTLIVMLRGVDARRSRGRDCH